MRIEVSLLGYYFNFWTGIFKKGWWWVLLGSLSFHSYREVIFYDPTILL